MFMMIIMTMMCFCYPQIIESLSLFPCPKIKFYDQPPPRISSNIQKLLFFLTFIIHTTYKKSDDDDVCISIDALSNRWYW